MSDSTSNPAVRANALWAAIAVLAVAVVALGSALYFVQARQEGLHSAAVSPVPTPMAVPAPATPAEQASPAAAPAQKEAAVPEKKTDRPAPARTAASHNKPAPEALPAAVGSAAPAAPAKEVCLNCATVTAVTPIEREGQGSGAGAVAGGVLGAIVGNQVGQGQGKDVATILGAIGGGIAGNTVEKKMKKSTVYRVDLRMDNGDLRSLEQATPASVGTRVRVEGDTLLPLGN